jgi:AcrR family transcriptional regulator
MLFHMAKKNDKAAGGKRDQLIDTALRLFARHGYRATGIDTIIAEAGVAKMTLYHHFKTKDELIVAALRRRDTEWREWFIQRVTKLAGSPRERLLAVFDVMEEWFRNKDYHGCSFGQAATEFRDPKHSVHKMASEHKQKMLAYFRELAGAAGAKDPESLAQQISLLVEGAVIHMEVFREPQVARIADAAAQKLVEEALKR